MKRGIVVALGTLLIGAFLLVNIAKASPAEFSLSWSTIDGGGGRSTGGYYALSGTLGQPDVGTISGGPYILSGGFWGADLMGGGIGYAIFLPIVVK